MEIAKANIVRSEAGRDKGKLFYVLDVDGEYLLLADYASYCAAEQRMVETYEDPARWNRMSLLNIARSGDFAADRAVREYADNIWRVPHR